jgi:hypothetical protein
MGGAPLAVAEDFVSFLRFLEPLLGFGAVRVSIRMMLHGQLAVGLLDVFFGGVLVDTGAPRSNPLLAILNLCLPRTWQRPNRAPSTVVDVRSNPAS